MLATSMSKRDAKLGPTARAGPAKKAPFEVDPNSTALGGKPRKNLFAALALVGELSTLDKADHVLVERRWTAVWSDKNAPSTP